MYIAVVNDSNWNEAIDSQSLIVKGNPIPALA